MTSALNNPIGVDMPQIQPTNQRNKNKKKTNKQKQQPIALILVIFWIKNQN